MLHRINMAATGKDYGKPIPYLNSADYSSLLDPSRVLELFVFGPIFYASICAIGVAIVKALINSITNNLVRCESNKPTLYYKESDFSRFLLRKIPRLTENYRTPRWCLHPDVQYLTKKLISDPKSNRVRFNRQFFQLKDRGLVALDWAIPATSFCNLNNCVWSDKKNKTVLLILPDFNGTSVSLGTICSEALNRGFRPVIFHRRGHGGCPLTTPKLQPYGDPSDLRQTIQYIKTSSPVAKLATLGYGVGADLLMAYLGEFGSSSFVSAGVAVSPLYDPELMGREGIRQPYSFISSLAYRKLISTHVHVLRKTADIRRVFKENRVDEAERILHSKSILSPLQPSNDKNTPNNFQQSFWERNAPLRDVDDISTPLLCVSSRDDPFLTPNSIPYEVFKMYPNLLLCVTEHGGHGAFLHDQLDDTKNHSWPWKVSSWADLLALNFLQATMEFAALEARCQRKRICLSELI